tara:strand:+ start:95 stop:499 length:405 start_codon:yes stop_codon:yes gene_type:complete
MVYADDIKGYGESRFIEVFFRAFKNNSYGYCSSKPAKTIEVFGGGVGRLSLMQPNQNKTTVQVAKTVVTVFVDIAIDKSTGLPSQAEVDEYMSDDLSSAFWDREQCCLVTKENLKSYIEIDDNVDESQVHYAVV